MEILNNAVCELKVSRPTFEDLHARLESIRIALSAGYKAEALEMLMTAQGMARNVESQMIVVEWQMQRKIGGK
jgi:hypothetical protein